MTTMPPRLRLLLRKADGVAKQNRLTAAEELYRELVEEFPDSADGWLGLARVVRDETEQEQIYNHVLTLDAENAVAQASLAGEPLPTDESEEAEKVGFEPSGVDTADASAGNPVEAKQVETHQFEPTAVVEEEVVGLRCNKCGKPIEAHKAVHTSVGYRCTDCIRELEDTYFTASPFDYILALMTALPLSIIAGMFAPILGFFIIFVGAAIGGVIATAVIRLVGARRGRYLPHLVAVCVIAGALLAPVFRFVLLPGFGGGRSLWLLIYAFIATSAAYYRMR